MSLLNNGLVSAKLKLIHLCRCSIWLILSVFSLVANATNGINLIGFGAESTLMAGADIAVARDTSALNTNPAGLTQLQGQAFDGFGSMLRTFDLTHKDSLGNEEHASNLYTFLGGGGYATSLESLPCTVGVGFFGQGGAGGVFENLNTAFGTKDDMRSLFGIAKISPGLGCKVNEKLSLGASLAITYASIEQELFPNTSFGNVFAGYKLKGASALKAGIKLGTQYRLTPVLTLAATYTEKIELPLTGGELTANYSGLGKVIYSDAQIQGLALPREIALGIAFKPDERWLLSMKLNWINWADAIKTVTLRATSPNNSLAPSVYEINTAGDWHNQWVIASGLAYQWSDSTTLYAGHNYGRNPVPTQNSSALLAAILEHHVTFGLAHQVSPEWRLTGGVEYMLPVKEKYNNALFGDAEVRNEAVFLHLMLSRRW